MALALLAAPARADDAFHPCAAGSLTDATAAMLAASGLPPDRIAPPVFGSSGVLRERAEAGAPADLLALADMAQPRLAAARGPPVVVFTRNSLCPLAPGAADATPANLLGRMLDPATRVGTSTPRADPGGDDARAVFARADALHPGALDDLDALEALEAKALRSVGGPDSKPLVPGKGQMPGVFLAHAADAMLACCTAPAAVARDVPGIVAVPLPPEPTVGPATAWSSSPTTPSPPASPAPASTPPACRTDRASV